MRCNNKYEKGEDLAPCSTSHLGEDTITSAFVNAFNDLIAYKDEVIAEHRCIIERLTDTAELDNEKTTLQSKCEVIEELIRKIVAENACSPLDQENYIRRYDNSYTPM